MMISFIAIRGTFSYHFYENKHRSAFHFSLVVTEMRETVLDSAVKNLTTNQRNNQSLASFVLRLKVWKLGNGSILFKDRVFLLFNVVDFLSFTLSLLFLSFLPHRLIYSSIALLGLEESLHCMTWNWQFVRTKG